MKTLSSNVSKTLLFTSLALSFSQGQAVVGNSGVIYYVCNNHQTLPEAIGDDANDGLSPSTAWKTFNHALSVINTLDAGDTIAFCRGGTFDFKAPYNAAYPSIQNRNATGEDPLVITSYIPDKDDDSCLQIPLIKDDSVRYFSDPNPACDNTPENCDSTPRPSNGPFYLADDAYDAFHNEGLVIEQLIIRSDETVIEQIANDAGLSDWHDLRPRQAINVAHDYDYVTAQYLEIEGFTGGITQSEEGFEAPNDTTFDKSNDFNTFSRLFIHNNYDQGFRGAGNNLLISETVFVDNGAVEGTTSNVRFHNIYLSKGSGEGGYLETQSTGFQNVNVLNNALYQAALWDEDNDPATPKICGGAPLIVHGAFNKVNIIGNLVWEDYNQAQSSCFGISVGSGYTYKHLDGIWNLNISDNIVMDTGGNIVGCTFCNNAIIDGNLLIGRNGPDAGQSKGAYAIKGIVVPQAQENDYDPCYQLLDPANPRTLTKVENSYQNGLPTDPTDIIGLLSNHPGTVPTTNINNVHPDGQWLNENGDLLQWVSANGNDIDRPFPEGDGFYSLSSQNSAYNALNCSPNHVLISDNQTRSARISNNTTVIDVYDEPTSPTDTKVLSGKSEAIELGDNLYNGLHELDRNEDGVVDEKDEVDTYSVYSNKAYYSSRTIVESADCAVDIHPTSEGVDTFDASAGEPNKCIIYDETDPSAKDTIAANSLINTAQTIAAKVPKSSEAFWTSEEWPRNATDPTKVASQTINDILFGECAVNAKPPVQQPDTSDPDETDGGNVIVGPGTTATNTQPAQVVLAGSSAGGAVTFWSVLVLMLTLIARMALLRFSSKRRCLEPQ